MKAKRIVMALMLVVLAGSAVSACAKPPPAPPEEIQKYLITSCVSKGTSRVLDAATGEIMRKHSVIDISIRTVAGSVDSFFLMSKGETDLLFLTPFQPLRAYNGKMEGVPKVQLRMLASAGAEARSYFCYITIPKTGIKSVADFRGKTIFAEIPAADWSAPISRAVMRVNGLTKDDFTYLTFTSGAEAIRDLKEGRIDAFMYVAGSASIELAEGPGVYIIPFTPEEQAAIAEETGGGLKPVTLPKGVGAAPVDTPVIGATFCWWASTAMNGITAYTLVKTLYENIEELHVAHKRAKGFTLENALNEFALPYHPGAIKYYKEVGIWKPEHDKKQQELLEKDKKLFD